VRALAEAGFETIAAARRLERCEALATDVGGRAARLDVTDQASIDELAASIDRLDLVVHSAGGALGLEPVAEFDDDNWNGMWESNVMGVARLTRALLPALKEAEAPAIQIIGSVAGVETYVGGGGYTAAKHAVHALAQTLRLELLQDRIRVTEIAPGLVETEFALVRFEVEHERAKATSQGLTPLIAEDIAEIVAFCATRPENVDIDYVAVKPTAQATAKISHRATSS
jgi:NADP-dependent 3-hydroxy acid dehydrogenase YdfG